MRLYPPFAVAIIGSALLWIAVEPRLLPGVSLWFNDGNWQPKPTAMIVLAHLAMTNNKHFQGLDVVMWSLVHEARISIIFPFIATAVSRQWILALLAAFIIAEVSRNAATGSSFEMWYNPADTLQFLALFVIGAVMALHATSIRLKLSSLSTVQKTIIWIAALTALVASTSSSSYSILAQGGAASVVALSYADARAERFLSSKLPAWLGKISYSLYLVHLPVLFTLVHVLWGRLPIITILALGVASSLLIADMMYRFVELPSMRIGRILAMSFTKPTYTVESKASPQNAELKA